MKRMIIGLILCFGFAASSASICDDPLNYNFICNKMKNLRGHIMMLESQRDLMQINYDYVRDVSQSMATASTELMNELPFDLEDHRPALQYVATRAAQVQQMADRRNPQVFHEANLLRRSCTSCHTPAEPTSGVKWEEIFKMDWSKIVQKCDEPGKNPFICKNMYGMVTNYSYILTAYLNKVENHKMIETSAKEIARISSLLVSENFLHDRMANIQEVNERAKEAEALALQKDPRSLEKAYEITESCMGCHTQRGYPSPLKSGVKIWN